MADLDPVKLAELKLEIARSLMRAVSSYKDITAVLTLNVATGKSPSRRELRKTRETALLIASDLAFHSQMLDLLGSEEGPTAVQDAFSMLLDAYVLLGINGENLDVLGDLPLPTTAMVSDAIGHPDAYGWLRPLYPSNDTNANA